jgi:hypothetical protein
MKISTLLFITGLVLAAVVAGPAQIQTQSQSQSQSQSLLLKSPNPLNAFCEVLWTAKDFQLNVLQALPSLKRQHGIFYLPSSNRHVCFTSPLQ